jgi:hypothetical protein
VSASSSRSENAGRLIAITRKRVGIRAFWTRRPHEHAERSEQRYKDRVADVSASTSATHFWMWSIELSPRCCPAPLAKLFRRALIVANGSHYATKSDELRVRPAMPAQHRGVRARGPDVSKIGGCGASGGPLSSRSLGSVTMISSLTVPTHYPERGPLHPLDPPVGRDSCRDQCRVGFAVGVERSVWRRARVQDNTVSWISRSLILVSSRTLPRAWAMSSNVAGLVGSRQRRGCLPTLRAFRTARSKHDALAPEARGSPPSRTARE